MALSGYDQPIGSAANVDESSSDFMALEAKARRAFEALASAQETFEQAITAYAEVSRELLRARRSALEAEITAALSVERTTLDTTISQQAARSRTLTGVHVVAAAEGVWPSWLEPKLQEAREGASSGEMAGVLLIRGLSGRGNIPEPETALVLDTSGRVPRPVSGLSAEESARRSNTSRGRW